MGETIRSFTNSWRRYLLWGIVLGLIVVPLVIAFTYMTLQEGDASKRYVPELRRIADETPMFPGFQKTGEKVVLKRGTASLFVYYRSTAKFSDIREFYDRALPGKGWGPPKTSGPSIFVPGEANWVRYRRGEYEVAVEQVDGEPESFDIVFTWEPQ